MGMRIILLTSDLLAHVLVNELASFMHFYKMWNTFFHE